MNSPYVHMEAARKVAQRLEAGDLPPDFPADLGDAVQLGKICHRWRNYLAVGSLGPDLFLLLPDFANEQGAVIRNILDWVLTVWQKIDQTALAVFDDNFGNLIANDAQLASQLTGGLSNQLGQLADILGSTVRDGMLGFFARLGDWFGKLSSGVPQGVGLDAFSWSDVFHYRRTYQFAYVLLRKAQQDRAAAVTDPEKYDAEARIAFAIGWMSHCATDVTGHPFTNAKCGGPYRSHWQRHHLIENHMDSACYSQQHSGDTCYDEYGTSALHFWTAFRLPDPALPHTADYLPYFGRSDCPGYDYIVGLPSYPLGDGPAEQAERAEHFGLTSGPLPAHLIHAILDAMAAVYPDGPKILAQDPSASAENAQGQPDGRPSDDLLQNMWDVFYNFLKMSGSDGLGPARPQAPEIFTDHSCPTPPGSVAVPGDPFRGAELGRHRHSLSLLDLILAPLACGVYLAQVAIWAATVLPGLILDVATFPARQVIYENLIVPAWNMYIAARRALVMTGFIVPKPEEVDEGLITLGTADGSTYDLAAALDDPAGVGNTAAPESEFTEPSGRASATVDHALDLGFPRNIVRDRPADVAPLAAAGAFGLARRLVYATDDMAEMPVLDRPSDDAAPPGGAAWQPDSVLAHAVVAAGFWYDPAQDIIFSTMYPWQRSFGYSYAVDAAAVGMNAVIDCEPVFFDYEDKSWMIEFWKGQYGLETGCEIGIYIRDNAAHSPWLDGVYTALDAAAGQRPHDPNRGHSRWFPCAGDHDLMRMSFTLYRDNGGRQERLFGRRPARHWWLTGFKWGEYSRPEDLTLEATVECRDTVMAAALSQAILALGQTEVSRTGTAVQFTYRAPLTHQPRHDVPALVTVAQTEDKAFVDAYRNLGLPTNDPNTVGRKAAALIGNAFATRTPEAFARIIPFLAELLDGYKASEWLAPWRYPIVNHVRTPVPREGSFVHVGPYVVGNRCTVLLPGPAGSSDARRALEDCTTPAHTEGILPGLLSQDKHLGGPVDYGLYLVGRMTAAAAAGLQDFPVPDFNLDADRGYGFHCWDWDRHYAGPDTPTPDRIVRGAWVCVPELRPTTLTDFAYRQPCTPPQLFDAEHDNPRQFVPDSSIPRRQQWYDPRRDLAVHYLGRQAEPEPPVDEPDPCGAESPDI